MEEPRTITLDIEQWERTVKQLEKLKQENKVLKNQIKILSRRQISQENENIRHSLTQSTFYPNFYDKQQTIKTQAKIQKQKQRVQFKTQMAEWLKKINQTQSLKFQKQNQLHSKISQISQISEQREVNFNAQTQKIAESVQLFKTQQKKLENDGLPEQIKQLTGMKKTISMKRKSIQPVMQKKQMKLIESICLFGPQEKLIREGLSNQKTAIKSSLLYSNQQNNSEIFKVYGQYFYPQGMITVRNIKQQEVATQVHQVIFRKNIKKQDCSIFLFRGDQNNQQLRVQNPILSKVNPGKWLIAFFIQFSDFQFLVAQQTNQNCQVKANRSVHFKKQDIDQLQQEVKNECQTDRTNIRKKLRNHFSKSKYTLCLFTYFPLINVMQQILSTILDQIKIKRVEKYATQNKVQAVSINFFLAQLHRIGQQIYNKIQKIPSSVASQVQLPFGDIIIKFDMNQNKIDDLLFSGWVHDILKIFDKDVIYDLYTNMMTEQSLCFVCQNMHILTYTIFFFVCIMPFPFTYPHPCISKVFNLQLLQSPFVVTAGINQSSKWLQENVNNYPKKIFVDLNDEAKIKGKRKPKNIKSQKLKKIFNNIYRKLEGNSPMPQIFKKKETIIKAATKEQNQSVITFIRGLQTFYQEQIFVHLPNPAIISYIKDKTDQKNETSKIFNILKQIQKYLKQSRKQREKDQFVDLLTQQQIFYVHMGITYSLD